MSDFKSYGISIRWPLFSFLNRPRHLQPKLLLLLREIICSLLYPVFRIFDIKFLSMNIYNIGHLCTQPDSYIKEGLTNSEPKNRPRIALLSAPANRAANPHILKYWNDYIRVISSPLVCFFLYPLLRREELTYHTFKYDHNHKNPESHRVESEYAGKPPLLALKQQDKLRGWVLLNRVGIPRDAWFVALHCRENGYTPNCMPGSIYNCHNAEIDNYYLAIEAIIQKGGWVIRMGDPAMKPLQSMPRVFDYAHSEFRCDWMDVFLSASCKFMLASSSGLFRLSGVFGRPVAVANLTPPYPVGILFWSNSLSIPKLVYSCSQKRLLNFREVFQSEISTYYSDSPYSENGLELIQNSPEEIRDLTLEMIDSLEGQFPYDEGNEDLQSQFKSLLDTCYPPQSRLGTAFLKKYQHLL